jgi:hypothetical protein
MTSLPAATRVEGALVGSAHRRAKRETNGSAENVERRVVFMILHRGAGYLPAGASTRPSMNR